MAATRSAGSAPPRRGSTARSAPRHDDDARSSAEVLRSLSSNAQALVRKEIELAKLEVTEIVTARVMAVAMFLGAAVLGLFILGFVGVTGAKALDLVLPEWAAWLIVTGVYILVAAVLALIGVRKLKKPPTMPERTKASVEETVEWGKQRVKP